MTAPATSASGPGWRASFRNPEHTVWFLEYDDDDGVRLSVRLDPREDGPSVYLPVEGIERLDEASRDRVLDRLAVALDGFFPHDAWFLWTSSWPRYPLRFARALDHYVDHWPPSRVQYGEQPGRAIDVVCTPSGNDASGRARVRATIPATPRWSFPPSAGALDATDIPRVIARLRAAKAVVIDVGAVDRDGDA